MVTLYFSGTGNSQYIAELFATRMGSDCHSIEEQIDFNKVIFDNDTIAFVYPIYGSYIPRIMRDFVTGVRGDLEDKKIIIFCTQYLFSGDGTRVFTELLPKSCEITYTEHFLMPSNICNFPPFSTNDGVKIQKYLMKAQRKMNVACLNIENRIVKKRGFTIFSKTLGLLQRPGFRYGEKKISKSIRIKDLCTRCGVCVAICPTHNLKIDNNKVQQNNICTLCYRCVNKCPEKAITVFIHRRVKRQYKGVKEYGR